MTLHRRRFLATLALAPLAAGCGRRTEDNPLLLGHLAPLSGPDRPSGEHARQGIVLAVEQVNKPEDRIAGRKLSVLHADTRGDPRRARDEAVRLLAVNRVVALLGPLDFAAAERVALALQSYTASLLTAASLRGRRDGVFSLDAATAFRAATLARHAADELKASRAVVLVEEDFPACASAATAFVRQWRDGGRQAQTWAVQKDDEAMEKRLGKEKPDVVVAATSAAGFSRLSPRLAPANPAPARLFAGEAVEWQRLVEGGEARGVFAVSVYPPPGKDDGYSEEGKKFLAAYRERYKEAPDLYALVGDEGVKVMASALRAAGGTGGTRLREELVKTDASLPGLTGPLSFRDGHARRSVFVVRGPDELVKEYKPAESK